MEEIALRLLTLARLPGFGPRRISSLVRADGVNDLYEAPGRFAELVGEPALELLRNRSARSGAEAVYRQAERAGQRVIALGSAAYPSSLAAIYDPPPVLFVRGGALNEGGRRVAIVGARGATPSGRSIARDLARGLAHHGIDVVSGLARGVDGCAHEGALTAKGTTHAVLGSSIDVIYPAEHQDLAARIVRQGGALVSELPPGTKPAPAQFPRRNRIIVGLAEAVIVVEAGSRSGALITARVALDEGRDVLTVPGRPGDPLAYGPNLLIRDGATLVRGVDDVLEYLGIETAAPKTLSSPPDKILAHLSEASAKTIDQLVVDTGLAAPLLMARLSELELFGKVERLPGTLFRSASPA